MNRLLMIDPAFCGQSCDLPDGTFSVGRRGDNDIVVVHPTVSARHCDILVHGPEVIVRNREARNGIFVDDIEIRGQSGIRHNQCLRLGEVRLLVLIASPGNMDLDEATASLTYQRWLRSAGSGCGDQPRFPRFLIPNPSA
jgi:pSer/pThr/pTyr-binding forkhead associated (FHA) protein